MTRRQWLLLGIAAPILGALLLARFFSEGDVTSVHADREQVAPPPLPIFVAFCPHGVGTDLDTIRPYLQEKIERATREQRKVTLFLEMGSIILGDSETGRIMDPEEYLKRLREEPEEIERRLEERERAIAADIAQTLHGTRPVGSAGPFAGYDRAVQRFIIEHTGVIAEVLYENVWYDQQVRSIELRIEQNRAVDTFLEGRFDDYERLIDSCVRLEAESLAIRDERFVIQMREHLRANPERTVIALRGPGHVAMKNAHGVEGSEPDLEGIAQQCYGIIRLQMLHLAGVEISEEEARAIKLCHAPGVLMETALTNRGAHWFSARRHVLEQLGAVSLDPGDLAELSRHLLAVGASHQNAGPIIERWLAGDH